MVMIVTTDPLAVTSLPPYDHGRQSQPFTASGTRLSASRIWSASIRAVQDHFDTVVAGCKAISHSELMIVANERSGPPMLRRRRAQRRMPRIALPHIRASRIDKAHRNRRVDRIYHNRLPVELDRQDGSWAKIIREIFRGVETERTRDRSVKYLCRAWNSVDPQRADTQQRTGRRNEPVPLEPR